MPYKIGYLNLLESYLKQDNRQKRKYWKCKCICGKIIYRREDYLKKASKIKNRIISCGCQKSKKNRMNTTNIVPQHKKPNLNFAKYQS